MGFGKHINVDLTTIEIAFMVLTTTDRNELTPEEIADLLVGVGVEISNVEITGYNEAIGVFDGGLSDDIGIESGVILSTGNIADAAGPNDGDGTGTDLTPPPPEAVSDDTVTEPEPEPEPDGGTSDETNDESIGDGDADLNQILGARTDSDREDTDNTTRTNDAIALEFDFVPENEEFVFEYVFASEEYNEFANSTFNDIFAFLLDDENIALIPGTTIPVSINNINASENASYFRNNDLDDLGVNDGLSTEFDGLTNTLAVRGYVTPGTTHHLKLVIADTGDSILDSAVFLKAGSLSTPPQAADATLTPNERDIFTIASPTEPAFAKLKFTLSGTNTDSINEVGIFTVDDDLGTINGVAPGSEGYEQLALGGVRSRAIFTGLDGSLMDGETLTRFLNYDVGSKVGFYMVTDGTSDMALSDTPLYFYRPKPQVLFSFPEENVNLFDESQTLDPLQVTSNGDVFTLAWEDDSNDGDYDDMVFTMEVSDPAESDLLSLSSRRQGDVQKEVIDLSILEDGESITANIEISGESIIESTVGLYRIVDGQGTVVDPISGTELTPEDDGYLTAAISQRVFEFGKDDSGSVELEAGFYAPYIVVNATAEQWALSNPTNFPHFDSFAYVPFLAADGSEFKYEHLALLGDNTFGFEDTRIAISDFDFDDMIMQVSF